MCSQQIVTNSFKIKESQLDLSNINDFIVNDNTFSGAKIFS